jgi:hypothetical protein
MKFEDLLKQHNVTPDQVVEKALEKAKEEDYGRLSSRFWEPAESPRDFLRAYEPIVRVSPDGHVEIRVLTDANVVPSNAKIGELSVNGVPIAVSEFRTERVVRTPPGSHAGMGMFLYFSGTSSELAAKAVDPSSVMVKGQIDGGPELVAIADKE